MDTTAHTEALQSGGVARKANSSDDAPLYWNAFMMRPNQLPTAVVTPFDFGAPHPIKNAVVPGRTTALLQFVVI